MVAAVRVRQPEVKPALRSARRAAADRRGGVRSGWRARRASGPFTAASPF